jgi:hypothetical protein
MIAAACLAFGRIGSLPRGTGLAAAAPSDGEDSDNFTQCLCASN